MTVHPKDWERYDRLRSNGANISEASRKVGINRSTASLREKRISEKEGVYRPGVTVRTFRDRRITGGSARNPAKRGGRAVPERATLGAIPMNKLSDEAKRGLEDFAFFRRRYFGRKSTPWQEEAANRCKEFLETPLKEFLVLNCPPGSGKSTLFPLELAAWITCRNRGIRGMIGSVSQSLAERYLLRLRNALESPYPPLAETEEIEQGLAFDADACLMADYGLFKPEGSVLWTAHAFIVSQLDDRPITEKEPTWSAYGLDSAFIGGRFDVAIWDDATEDKHLSTPDRIDKQRDRWDKVAEKRLEPGGLLVLQGQRLGPEDLYRHALDKKAGSSQDVDHSGCCSAEAGRKYHHIVYKAHYDDRCLGDHDPGAYYPDGCLLDPHRLSWRELEAEMENSSTHFQTVYQQEDIDPAHALVDMFWIKGGEHPVTREIFPGCWDDDRGLWEIPTLSQPFVAYMTVDPSPTKMWGIEMWVYHPKTNLRFLIDLMSVKMPLGQFFDWNDPKRQWTGVLPDWYQRSVIAGFPISTLVFEQNAAQRFFLATDALRRWQQDTGVRIIGHETFAANKLDPALGPQTLSELYRRGLVRLPGHGDKARMTSLKLVTEVTRYPQHRTDDLVMSQWMGEANLTHIYNREPPMRITWRPTWMRDEMPA